MKRLQQLLKLLFPIHTNEIAIVLLVLVLLFTVQFLTGNESEIINSIHRPSFFNGDEKLTLYYEDENLELYKQPLSITIDRADVKQKEVDKYLEIVSEVISNRLATQYSSYELIEGAIDLPEKYEKCKVLYKLLPNRLISQEGWINYALIDESEMITIDYEIVFGENNKSGSVDIEIDINNISDEYKQKYLENNIISDIQVLNESIEGDVIELPGKVTFYNSGENDSLGYLIFLWLLIVICCSMIAYYELRLRNKVKKSRKKIEITYLINSFILLYQTGMTMQKSFKVTINNRLISLDKNDFIYNDLLMVKARIDSGQRFDEVLNGFVEVFDLRESIRFNRLLLQTLKQGDDHLIEQLDYMTKIMWEERIRDARKESEKASSKLVFPMLLIFIVILIISIVPTFLEVKSIF